MTNAEINTAIAEATGWILTAMNWWFKDGEYFSLPPDYCNDLNAMHEAEKVLQGKRDWSCCIYDEHLSHMTSSWKWNATARQRAEAFLKTVNLWKP